MNFDVLAFGAHPDDIEIFCSGTLHKCIKNELKVAVVDITKAELSTRGNLILRAKETSKSNQILGLKYRDCLEIPDGNIEFNQTNKIKVITIIRKFRPKIILIPYFECRHPDHQNTGLLVKEAAFYAGLEKISTFYNNSSQEPFRPNRIFYYMEMVDFKPTFIVDISDEFETKLNSIKAFKSQFFDENNMDRETFISKKSFIEHVKMRAKYFGFKIGVEYGEPYFCSQPIVLRDIKSFINFGI
jgi:bacillithiol biosynthesis deacetylase BshB1